LTAHRQTTPVAYTAVAAQIHQPLDAHGHLAAQVTFHSVLGYLGAQSIDLGFAQIANLEILGDTGRRTNLLGASLADSINGLQRDDRMFVDWNVDTCNTGHALKFLPSR
jgi:hypothetical protein